MLDSGSYSNTSTGVRWLPEDTEDSITCWGHSKPVCRIWAKPLRKHQKMEAWAATHSKTIKKTKKKNKQTKQRFVDLWPSGWPGRPTNHPKAIDLQICVCFVCLFSQWSCHGFRVGQSHALISFWFSQWFCPDMASGFGVAPEAPREAQRYQSHPDEPRGPRDAQKKDSWAIVYYSIAWYSTGWYTIA